MRVDLQAPPWATPGSTTGVAARLSGDRIVGLARDREGPLWVATLASGLNRLDALGAFERFRHDPADPECLGSDFVRPIHEDRRGYLWVGLQGAGLDRLDPRTGRSIHYRHDDGDHAQCQGLKPMSSHGLLSKVG